MEKIGIYSRVSSKTQEDDGTSIDYQIKMGNEISKKLGFKSVIFNEGGKTSWNSNINTRPELVRILNEIESKNIKSIWVWNMDRLGRNSESWYTIMKILIGWKVSLYLGESLKPYNFNNPTDRLVTQVLSLITTYDNELRRTRMIFGKMETLKKGRSFIGGTTPFGYDVDESKNLIPNPLEKKMVNKIYKMYKDGKSTTDIKVKLDSSIHKPRRSNKGWNIGTIQKMLRNELYIGKQIWEWTETDPDGAKNIIETIEIKTPKLIDKKLFSQVQNRFNKYTSHNQYDTDLKSLLKGFLVCNHCGLPMNHRMKENQSNDYYYCVYTERKWGKVDRKGKHSDNTCSMKKSLIMKQTDELVWDNILMVFSNSKYIKEGYKVDSLKPKDMKNIEIKSKRQSYRNKLSKLKKDQTSLNDSMIDVELKNIQGKFSKEVYEGILLKLSNQINSVENEIGDINSNIEKMINKDNWVDWISIMSKELKNMKEWTFDKKKEKLNQFIDKIFVNYNDKNDTHKLSIDFKIPIVGDKIVYKDVINKSIGYQWEKGENRIIISHKNKSYKLSEKKKELVGLFLKLRGEGKSYTDIANILNNDGISTITGKKWNKHNVGRFNNYIPQSVGLELESVSDKKKE